ncbi:glycosyltransferase [Roseovarius autotrophicus]|uniref:glycosyltransferase n=1 Tax=Roseovarius autotrophicus TaxID=2824121 RepID=UPI001B38CDB0|nr:glycosyltransferase [Roseovarius autotrophicus]
MTEMTERPLVTFAVIAYNQERFIREAIEGAFSQTYEPLEIILSDDCSSDRTYQIMQEMAAAYNGPHKVVLNRNMSNLGLVPHIDRVMEMVSGDFIVVNAGDDVSLPERTSILAEIWRKSNRTIKLLHSSARRIDLEGDDFGVRTPPQKIIHNQSPEDIILNFSWVIGATAAWDREIFDTFGPIGGDLSIEDHIIPFMASIVGKIYYVQSSLVKHRSGGSTKKTEESIGRNYLYGGGLKSRKWDLETDRYVLGRIEDWGGKKKIIYSICSNRQKILEYSIMIAELNKVRMILSLPDALRISHRHKTIRPLKDWTRYVFDFLYIPYANWNIKRQLKNQGLYESELPHK